MKHFVEDWMTKHPLKIDVNEDVEGAEDIMNDEAIRHLLVTDHGQLVGVLSNRDLSLVEKIRSRFTGLDCINVKISVGDLMGRCPSTVSENSVMGDAIRLMNDKSIHALPVVDKYGRLTGILTSTDVMRYALVASQQSDAPESYSKIVRGI